MPRTRLVLALLFGFHLVAVANAESFDDALLADKAAPTTSEVSEFSKAIQGTWVADYEIKPPYPTHVDFIDQRFVLLPDNLTDLRSSAQRTGTMLLSWDVLELKRVPLGADTLNRIDEVAAHNNRIAATQGADGKWIRRPSNVAAFLLLGMDWGTSALEQAIEDGVDEVWTAKIAVHAPVALVSDLETGGAVRGWDAMDNANTYIVLAGDRVYIGATSLHDRELRPLLREEVIQEAQRASFRTQRQRHLAREQQVWQGRCRQLRGAAVESSVIVECETWRDSYLKLGLEKLAERPLDRDLQAAGISRAEDEFLNGFTEPTLDAHQPYLDYCLLGLSAEQQRTIHARLAARQFSQTAWRLTASVRYTEAPRGWTPEDHRRYQNTLLAWERLLWLREDGVLGVNSVFQPDNRWAFSEDKLTLNLGGLVIDAPLYENFPVIDSRNSQNAALYNLELIGSNAELYQDRALDQNHPQHAAILAEVQTMRCTLPAQTAVATPAQVKPLSDFWHIRIVPADSSAKVDAGIVAFWDKGVYAFLRDDGKLGFNTDDPGPYFFLGDKTWSRRGNVLTISLDGMDYAFELPTSEATTLTTIDSGPKQFRMLLARKDANQR